MDRRTVRTHLDGARGHLVEGSYQLAVDEAEEGLAMARLARKNNVHLEEYLDLLGLQMDLHLVCASALANLRARREKSLRLREKGETHV